MTPNEVKDAALAYGPVGLIGKSEDDLRMMVCVLAQELKDTQARHFSATFVLSDPLSKTEWAIQDNANAFRFVSVVKRVTHHVGMDFERAEETPVLNLDRAIAEQIVASLNSQNATPVT